MVDVVADWDLLLGWKESTRTCRSPSREEVRDEAGSLELDLQNQDFDLSRSDPPQSA